MKSLRHFIRFPMSWVPKRNLIVDAKVPRFITENLEEQALSASKGSLFDKILAYFNEKNIEIEAQELEEDLMRRAADGCNDSHHLLEAIHQLKDTRNTALFLTGTPTIPKAAERFSKLIVSIYDKDLNTQSNTALDLKTKAFVHTILSKHTDHAQHNKKEKPSITALNGIQSDGLVATRLIDDIHKLYELIPAKDKAILSEPIYSYTPLIFEDETRHMIPILHLDKNNYPTFVIDNALHQNMTIHYKNSQFSKQEIDAAVNNMYEKMEYLFENDIDQRQIKSGESLFMKPTGHDTKGCPLIDRHLLASVFSLKTKLTSPSATPLHKETVQNQSCQRTSNPLCQFNR